MRLLSLPSFFPPLVLVSFFKFRACGISLYGLITSPPSYLFFALLFSNTRPKLTPTPAGMVAEAIANGTWLPPAPRVKVDLRKKPRLWDAWVAPPLNAAPGAGGPGADGLLSPGADAQAHASGGAKGDASGEKDEWDAIMVRFSSFSFFGRREGGGGGCSLHGPTVLFWGQMQRVRKAGSPRGRVDESTHTPGVSIQG